MGIRVMIAPVLQKYSDIPGMLEVNGNTVGECLDDLIRQYPEVVSWLFDRNGLRRVLVSVNNAETVTLNQNGLDRFLHAYDELQIFPIIGGG